MTNEMDRRRLLLISSSTVHGGGYLDHAELAILTWWEHGKARCLHSICASRPKAYASKAHERFQSMGPETHRSTMSQYGAMPSSKETEVMLSVAAIPSAC
jgi:hypothetical protein